MLTAKVLIRLAAKLEAAGQYIDIYESDDAYHTASEDTSGFGGGVHLPTDTEESTSDSSSEGVSLVSNEPFSPGVVTKKNKKKKAKRNLKQVVKEKTAFSHEGMFDLLGEDPGDRNEAELELGLGKMGIDGPSEGDSPTPQKVIKMPPWDSDFWNTYGNKLRVNGTVEGVCKLRGKKEMSA